MAKKLTYEFVKSKFEECGYKLISETYINARTKLLFICPKHGDMKITYDALKSGNRCNKCGLEKQGNTTKHSYVFIKEEFRKRGYILLDDCYIDRVTNLKAQCGIHGIFEITYNSLNNGCGCKYCGAEKIANTKRLNYNTVKEAFEKRGYELISNEYIDCHSKLEYKCKKHGSKFINYANLSLGKGCRECADESMTGCGHPNWQGGLTILSDYIRSKCVNDYHKDLIATADYTCTITNMRGIALEVHHTYAFHSILRDTLSLLNLDVRPTIGEYVEEELCNIKDKFIELQALHESIVLSKEVHKLFHDTYGRGDNTIDQWNEFKVRYASGEFAEQLTA